MTLDVVMRIEQACDKSIIQIAQSLTAGELTTTQQMSILTPAIRAGGNDISEKDVGEYLWDAGLQDGIKAISAIIGQVLTSGEDEGNEEKAEDNRLV